MGRRALPKVDRSISIESYYYELDDLAPPLGAATLFGQNGQLELEIGSGKGLFLLNASAADPQRHFLGVEIAKKYARFAAYRLAKQDRANAKIIRGDALRLVGEYLPDESVQAVHVYFPDPWWKERHRRRRVMQPEFIRQVQRVLCRQGVFHFWTDVEEYFQTTCQMIAKFSDLSGPHTVAARPAEHDMDYTTHFERRMRLNDHPVFRSQFIR